jgi:hypothetical protein
MCPLDAKITDLPDRFQILEASRWMPDANSSGWHPDNVIQRMLDKKSSGRVVLKHFKFIKTIKIFEIFIIKY